MVEKKMKKINITNHFFAKHELLHFTATAFFSFFYFFIFIKLFSIFQYLRVFFPKKPKKVLVKKKKSLVSFFKHYKRNLHHFYIIFTCSLLNVVFSTFFRPQKKCAPFFSKFRALNDYI